MIKLSDIKTRAPKELTKEDIKRKTDRMARRIGDLQHILSAEKKHSLLIVLQGMDASGKDGVTRKIFPIALQLLLTHTLFVNRLKKSLHTTSFGGSIGRHLQKGISKFLSGRIMKTS